MCNCHLEKDDCAKVGNCLQKNTSWLVTAEKCYRGAKENKACASGHTRDSANVHLQTCSHISANSQTVWVADEINSIGPHFLLFSSALEDPLSGPTSRVYFRAVDRENDSPQPGCVRPFRSAIENVHNHRQQHPVELIWLTEFGLSVSKTVGGMGRQFFAINPEAQNSQQAFNVCFFFFFSLSLLLSPAQKSY